MDKLDATLACDLLLKGDVSPDVRLRPTLLLEVEEPKLIEVQMRHGPLVSSLNYTCNVNTHTQLKHCLQPAEQEDS